MKVAYICYLPQIDTDLSYVQEAQKICDLTTYIYINPKHFNKSLIKLNKLYEKTGIFDISIYPEFEFLRPLINLEKVKVINIANRRLWELKAFNVFNSLSKQLNKEFDIVHLTGILQPPEFPLYRLGQKNTITIHDPLPHSGSDGLKYRLARYLAMKLINNFIIFNKVQASAFKDYYKLQRKRILISQFGIFPWFKLLDSVSTSTKVQDSKPYILFAGRITQYKGIDYLLPAMERVHEKFPNINLIIAGGGDFYFDISKWNNLSYIEIRNRFIPDSELFSLIKNSLFVVCPYTDATQSGVVMSAFTFNKPVLATNVGGLPEMIISNRYGLVVEEKNIKALSEGISQLLSNPRLVSEYSRNIEIDYSKGERSWRKIANQIVDFYKTVISFN